MNLKNIEALCAVPGSLTPAVLVLGGSTFMGRELVASLLALPARVCTVNRGRRYWGTDDPSGGRTARVLADRRDREKFALSVGSVTQEVGRWALVADFSAFDGQDINCALKGLEGRFDTYAFISSDSVYEVSSLAGDAWRRSGGSAEQLIDEVLSVRSCNPSVQRRLRKADGYGDGKLAAEEALSTGLMELSEKRLPTSPKSQGLALRLPDVIGPFDDTLRLWAYWYWLRAGPDAPPQVCKGPPAKRARVDDAGFSSPNIEPPFDIPLAFVFSQDVARFITGMVGSVSPPDGRIFDAVNVGCTQQPTMRELLHHLARASGVGEEPLLEEVEKPRSFLPSVERPWPLSFEKLQKHYAFEATPLPDVLKACALWFDKSSKDFPREARRAAKKLPSKAREAILSREDFSGVASSSSSSDSASSDSS